MPLPGMGLVFLSLKTSNGSVLLLDGLIAVPSLDDGLASSALAAFLLLPLLVGCPFMCQLVARRMKPLFLTF
jgi:hypothetical protein